MLTRFVIASVILVAPAAPTVIGADPKPPKGPAPLFVTVQRLDAEKGELVVSEECLPHPDVIARQISVPQKNHREESKPSTTGAYKVDVLYYTTTHKLPLKRVVLYEAGGKRLGEKDWARLKPGLMILMSADGHPVEPEYTALIKPETPVLVVEVSALPSPYESPESTEGHVKTLRK
jgi:hypothetical protein